MDGGKRHLFANALDIAYAEQAKSMDFASMITVSEGAVAPDKKNFN